MDGTAVKCDQALGVMLYKKNECGCYCCNGFFRLVVVVVAAAQGKYYEHEDKGSNPGADTKLQLQFIFPRKQPP